MCALTIRFHIFDDHSKTCPNAKYCQNDPKSEPHICNEKLKMKTVYSSRS